MAPTGGGGGVPKPAGGRVPSDQVGAGPDGFLADHVAGMGRCDHHVVPGVDAIVIDVPGVVVEEDDVTRLLRILRQVLARGVLVDGEVRQPCPESAEDDHDQAGAVERVWTGGAPLVGGAAGPNTFDCSGLVMVVFGRFGIGLPHFTVDQYAASQHLAQDAKQPGDVLFFYDDTGYIYHDGIYAGNNMMIAATHTGDVVRQEAIWTGAYLVGRYPAPASFGTPPPPPPVGAIGQHYAALGGPSSVLGAPVTDELGTPGGRGRFNHFQGGSIYWTPQTDAHEVHGAIRDAWAGMGWETSLLGFPVTNELGTPDKFGRFNHFEGGSVYWSPDTGAHEVHGDIRAAWAAMGWENSGLGFPVSSEYAVPGGRASDFQGGTLRWDAGTRAVTVG